MLHPFAGIMPTGSDSASDASVSSTAKTDENIQTRRSFFGFAALAVAAAAVGTLASNTAAQARRMSTRAMGEEGGGRPGGRPGGSTRALGEEGGGRPGRRPGGSTRALGEEGGRGRPSGRYTTYALGEEGGGYRRRRVYRRYRWSRRPYCRIKRRNIFDRWGRYIGRRFIRVCG